MARYNQSVGKRAGLDECKSARKANSDQPLIDAIDTMNINEYQLIGDSLAYFLARESLEPDSELQKCKYLKEQIPLETLYQAIEEANFDKKKAILSMGQLELNYSRKPNDCIEQTLLKIANLVLDKGFEQVIVLFPVIKPRMLDEMPIGLNRYYAYRRAFERLSQDKRIRLWRSPAQLFLKMEEIPSTKPPRKRPEIDENKNLTPDKNKFYWSQNYRRFYLARSMKKEVIDGLNFEYKKMLKIGREVVPRKPLQRHKQENEPQFSNTTTDTSPKHHPDKDTPRWGDFKDLNHHQMKEIAMSLGVDLRPEWLVRESEKLAHLNRTYRQTSVAANTQPKKAVVNLANIQHLSEKLDTSDLDSEYETASENEDESYVLALDTKDKLGSSKIQDKIDSSLKAQLIGEEADEVSCVVPLKIGEEIFPTQLDKGHCQM
ncbi:hypothetical protein U1Q18_044203 [Sarracenia purpurea var. burkii]